MTLLCWRQNVLYLCVCAKQLKPLLATKPGPLSCIILHNGTKMPPTTVISANSIPSHAESGFSTGSVEACFSQYVPVHFSSLVTLFVHTQLHTHTWIHCIFMVCWKPLFMLTFTHSRLSSESFFTANNREAFIGHFTQTVKTDGNHAMWKHANCLDEFHLGRQREPPESIQSIGAQNRLLFLHLPACCYPGVWCGGCSCECSMLWWLKALVKGNNLSGVWS